MLRRIASFFKDDHRYVFLGTSALALVGLWLSMQPRTSSSFLAQSFTLELVLYYLLLAWVVLSVVALVNKLLKWNDYAETSPFTRPGAKKIERYLSYVVWAIVAVFFFDRVVMGMVDLVQKSTTASSNPTDFLASTI